MTSSLPAPTLLYSLRGTIKGRERTWLLPPGENNLGKSSANDVVLAVQGVSRRHALLRADASGIEVEDLLSTNGTFVNDRRIERSKVAVGDRLRFGPVALTLEEIDADDAHLAFELQPSPPGPRSEPATEESTTDRLLAAPQGLAPGGVAGIEHLLDLILALPTRDATAVLQVVQRELHAEGLGLFEWSGRREPVILAGCGRVEDPAAHPRVAAAVAEAERLRPGTSCQSGTLAEPRRIWAVLARPGSSPLCVCLSGGPAGDGGEEILRVVLRLFGWLPGWRPSSPTAPGGSLPILRFPAGFVVGSSQAMERLYGEIRALCRGELPVLVTGETGVGKEHVARILHDSSPRAKGPFVAMNCAAIPPDLLEAEMFGVAPGAATGVRARDGRIAQAAGGTLFLDELGDMSLALQAKLLRTLQEKEIQPVGGRPVAVDVRIVAATNKDLLAEVLAGRFRRDLYYRVAGATLTVPPLCERRDDIPPLVESFLRAAANANDAGRAVRGLTVKALRALVAYPWPGNVRELEHEVHRLAQACPPGQAIDSALLGPRFDAGRPSAAPAPATDSLHLNRHVADLENRLIRQALERAGGSHRKAATLLGISRNALARKVAGLGIAPAD